MSANPISVQAGGNISPARIVIMQGGSNSFQVIQATGATVQLFGIADESTYQPPNTPFDAGFTAIAGLPLRVFQLGEEANVETGATLPINAGDWLTSDSNGRAITAVSGQYVVGQALEQATLSLQRIRCAINPSKY